MPGLAQDHGAGIAQALPGKEGQRHHQQDGMGQVEIPILQPLGRQQHPAQGNHVEHDDGSTDQMLDIGPGQEHQHAAEHLADDAQPEQVVGLAADAEQADHQEGDRQEQYAQPEQTSRPARRSGFGCCLVPWEHGIASTCATRVSAIQPRREKAQTH